MNQVWLTQIAALAPYYEAALLLLPQQRREKTLAYREEADRLRSLGAGLLLAGVLGVREDAQLITDALGKLHLAAGGPCFSLTHGGDFVALAKGDAPLGLDIEPCSRSVAPGLVARVCTEAERAWLGDPVSMERFFLLWTRKESVAKALGKGILLPFAEFSVCPADPAPYLVEGTPCTVESRLYAGHALSLASLGPDASFTLQQLRADALWTAARAALEPALGS